MQEGGNAQRVLLALMAVAIAAAPFLGVLYSAPIGLGLMALALVAVSQVLQRALPAAEAPAQVWLRRLYRVNLALAVACLLAAIWLGVR